MPNHLYRDEGGGIRTCVIHNVAVHPDELGCAEPPAGAWFRTAPPTGGTRYWRDPAGEWFIDAGEGRPPLPVAELGFNDKAFTPAGMDAGVARRDLIPEAEWSGELVRVVAAACAAGAARGLFTWGHGGCPGRFTYLERTPMPATVFACATCGQHRVQPDDPAAADAAMAALAGALISAAGQIETKAKRRRRGSR